MAYTTINKPSATAFNTKLYTGNGSTQSITGVGFQPDLVWLKVRSNADNHCWFDSVRGVQKRLASNLTAVESNRATALTSFDSDGFTLGDNSESNTENYTYASWNWKANGAGSANTAGSINSTVSANTTAGFSIVSYTGTGSNATVGHGLGVAPSMIINKCRSASQNWATYHSSLGGTKALFLDNTDAQTTSSSYFNNTDPTSSVFSVGNSGDTNKSSQTHISYCFAEKKGYSKFGSYGGNQNANGTFVYTGFKPAFLMIKRYSTGNPSATNWLIIDNKRNNTTNTGNLIAATLKPNLDSSQGGNNEVDFLSNGFKWRGTDSDSNHSGHNYIYMAFAEAPLVGTNNVPCTAR